MKNEIALIEAKQIEINEALKELKE